MAFSYLIDADIPKNTGALRPLKVIAKQGTIVWADPGRPVTLCTSHPSNEIVEAIVKAMSASCPERAMAGWSRRFRIAIQGEDPRTGKNFIWHMFQARPGGGASSGGDGYSSIGEWHSVGGLKFGSIEVAEVRFPLYFRQHEFRPGSGGDGQFRGGLGVSLDWCWKPKSLRGQYRGRWRAPRPLRNARRRGWTAASLSSAVRRPRAARVAHQGSRHRTPSRRLPRNTLLRRRRMGTAGQAIGKARQRDASRALTDTPAERRSSRCSRSELTSAGPTPTWWPSMGRQTIFAKSPSTPADQSIGVMAGLEELRGG